MRKIWVKEWFGINLSNCFELQDDRLADTKAYKKFYQIFYERFSDFDDLPLKYQKEKTEIAKDIYTLFESLNSKNVLSIGSGIGYIEKRIYELSKKINITAIEPSIEINRFRLPNKIVSDMDFSQILLKEKNLILRMHVLSITVLIKSNIINLFMIYTNLIYLVSC